MDLSYAVVRNAPNRHAVILVDERTWRPRTVVWHRDQRLAMGVDEFPATLIGQARLLHVDDLDEDASIGRGAGGCRRRHPGDQRYRSR